MTDPDEPSHVGADRVIDLAVEVPGTPDDVWGAIATGPGITSWFVPHEVEEHPGGSVRMDFGGGLMDAASIAAWEPPARLVLEGDGDRALAFEWLVEARDGASCVVRLVVTGFGPGEDWDAEFHGMSEGWPLFLENLRLHLTHFPGERARAVIPSAMMAGPLDAAFETACRALGVPDDLRAGDLFQASAPAAPLLNAQVASVRRTAAARAYFLVLDAPAPGTAILSAERGGDHVGLSLWLYVYGDAAAALADVWSPFVATLSEVPEPAA